MEDDGYEEQQQQERLTGALWKSVQDIVNQEARSLGKQVTPGFTASLTEILYNQMTNMASDLEAFASHAKRSVISMEDVKLCARRNENLHALISEAAKEITEEAHSNKKKRK